MSSPRTTALLVLIALAVEGCCGVGRQTYQVAWYNSSTERIEGVEAIGRPEMPCGVLSPGIAKEDGGLVPPPPASLSVRWRGANGSVRQQVVEIAPMIRKPRCFVGTIVLKFTPDGIVAKVKQSHAPWTEFEDDEK